MKITSALICSLLLFSGTLVAQWTQYHGSPNRNDEASCITLDNQNNIIVGGFTITANGDADMAIIKYSQNGGLQWQYFYNNNNGNYEDRAYGIVVDQNDNIFITGYTSENSDDFCTIKLTASGTVGWVRKFDGGGEDRAYGIVVDNLNNIIVTGTSYRGPSTGIDIFTRKYDAAGNQLWSYTYNGTGNGEDRPYGIIVDQSDNIIITGTTYSLSSISLDYLTFQLSPSGSLVWADIYNGSGGGEDRAYGIVTDQADGKIFVTGMSQGIGSGFDYLTRGYDSYGALLFSKDFNGTGNSDDIARSITHTTNNEIVITGSSRSGPATGSENILTIRYDENGDLLWSVCDSGTTNNTDIAYKVVTPQNSNNYVTVLGYTTGISGKDILLLSYSNTGNLFRKYIINGSGNKNDIAYDGISINNDLVYAGFVTNSNNNTDFITSLITQSLLTEVIKDPEIIPVSFKLYQNYPNPFNPETKIKFDIPSGLGSGITVSLKVYDILGNEISTPVNRFLEAGSYEITLKADNQMSSGIYFYTLKAGGFIQTNKLIVLK